VATTDSGPTPRASRPSYNGGMPPAPDGPQKEFVQELYDELRVLAGNQLARPGRPLTLQPTALVHEVYLKFERTRPSSALSRTHFLALASRAMRQILMDHERTRRAAKRGGDQARVTLSGLEDGEDEVAIDVLALEDALRELGELSPLKVALIELRFFAGLSEAEAAEQLGISRASTTRHWRFARAWLLKRLSGDDPASA